MLRWYPQLARSVVYPFNTSESNPRKFFLYNHTTEAIEQEFDTSDDCEGCFDLSPDGKLLAVKYWSREKIDLIDVATGNIRSSLGPSRVSELRFDRTGTKLLVKAKTGGVSILSLDNPHDETRVTHVRDICDGCSVPIPNHFLIPSRRKNRIVRLDFDTSTETHKEFTLKCTVKCIRHSPDGSAVALLDSSGAVSYYDTGLTQLIWKTRVKPEPPDGQVVGVAFSGNGQLIGVNIVHYNGGNTVVLNSNDGNVCRTLIDASTGVYPFADDCTLSSCGEILNLKTGVTTREFCELADYQCDG